MRVLGTQNQRSQRQRVAHHLSTAVPDDQSNGEGVQQFDGRIEPCISQNAVEVGIEVFFIDSVESAVALALAVVELHDGHTCNVFLQERIDFRDRNAYAAVRVAGLDAKHRSGEED